MVSPEVIAEVQGRVKTAEAALADLRDHVQRLKKAGLNEDAAKLGAQADKLQAQLTALKLAYS